ncbi:uncharacterized protein LOC120584026 isoform X5 [Pteropus medius]|uniref:uncharacterized protein LOC120584026 isoform X5 n=1 Tax=Pteropus vampyrus TaxID=132908 RepID=UPI00196B5FB7|nr:uncharacterized protein LOC120584026 isoform X5 [Pteropus giganteus]
MVQDDFTSWTILWRPRAEGGGTLRRQETAGQEQDPAHCRDRLCTDCAKRAVSANASFLEEYQLPLQAIPAEAGSVAPPPGCKPHSTACECWAAVRGWGPCGLAGTIGRLTLPSSSFR